MYLTWDEAKSAGNLRDRGFDFAFATMIFEGPTLEKVDIREDCGEQRVVSVGVAQGWYLTVVWTERTTPSGHTVRRIVSARRSNHREREAWRQANDPGTADPW